MSLIEIGDDARALGMTRVAVFTDHKVVQLESVWVGGVNEDWSVDDHPDAIFTSKG